MLDVGKHTSLELGSRNRRLLIACAAFLNVLLSFGITTMSQRQTAGSSSAGAAGGSQRRPRKKKSDKPKASWTDAEIKTMVDYLHSQWAAGADAGNFRPSIMHGLVAHLHATHPDLPAKDFDQTKGKWKSVCHTTSTSHSSTYLIDHVAKESLDSNMRLQKGIRAALGPCTRGKH